MAVTLTGTGGLFTRLGKLAKVLRTCHTHAGGNLATQIDDAVAALTTEYLIASPLPTAKANAQSAASAVGADLQFVAQQLLLKQVNDDAPQSDRRSLDLAMRELVRQMVAGSASVAQCAVSATPAAVGPNTGTGVVVASVKTGTGLDAQDVFAETGELLCTGDAQSGTATAGSEPFGYRGDYAPADKLSHEWPGYSGAATGLLACDSQQSNGANLLTNSGFEAFATANAPDNWALGTGVAGTHWFSEATTVHRGTAGLKLVGDGSVLHALRQTFSLSTGTAAVPRPNRLYAVNLWFRQPSTLTGPTLALSLVDGSDANVADDQAAANTVSVALSGAATGSWVALSGVFRTPRVLPATLKLQLAITGGAIGNAAVLFVDSLALTEMTELYAGGPSLAVFSGATAFVAGDRYQVAVANNRAGATYGGTFQTVFDRWFGMRELGLLLPYSGSPTIADTLITS